MPIIPDHVRVTASRGQTHALPDDLSGASPDAAVGAPPAIWRSTRSAVLTERAFEPVSGASLRFFRVLFGSIVLISAVRLLWLGWPTTLYAGPRFHFAYFAMDWVPVLSPLLMQVQVALIAAAALAVVVGYRYRLAITVVWVLFTWMEFSEASVYLNHYWFVTLASALMIFLPMDSPGDVPAGAVWMVRFQVGVVYCFAGLTKLNADWLVHGLPMAMWLPAKSDLLLIGGVLGYRGTALMLSWAGAIFDCTIVALLLWRRTRLFAWLAVVGFHVATWVLFPIIGVFPFLMIGASLIFFDPDWPVVARRRLGRAVGPITGRVVATRPFEAAPPSPTPPSPTAPVASPTAPVAAPPSLTAPVAAPPSRSRRRFIVAATIVWAVIQIAIPLRQYVIPGEARWSGEGFRFGWNVLAVEKAGDVTFIVTDLRSGDVRRTNAVDLYTPQQWRAMSTDPELIRQAAHHVAETEALRLRAEVGYIQVRVDAFVSLNGRAAQRLIDPGVNLAGEPARWHQSWITDVPRADDVGK